MSLGITQFDDLIGEEHRQAKLAKEGTVPEVEAETETSKRKGGASGVINILKQIQKDVLTLPTKCAEVKIASSLINSTSSCTEGVPFVLADSHREAKKGRFGIQT